MTLDFVNNQDVPDTMSSSIPGGTPYGDYGTYPHLICEYPIYWVFVVKLDTK
jgi:hypothetical protein